MRNSLILVWILTFMLLISLTSALDYTDNNMAFYRFTGAGSEAEAIKDNSPSGFDLTNDGATWTTETGFDFDGFTQYLSGRTDTALDLGTEDFVICAWMDRDNAAYAINKRDPAGDGYFFGLNAIDKLTFYGGAGVQFLRTNAAVGASFSKLYCSVADRSTVAGNKMYVNSVNEGLTNNEADTGSLTDTAPFEIGRDHDENYYNGQVGAVYIWKGVGIAQDFDQTAMTEIYGFGEDWNLYPTPSVEVNDSSESTAVVKQIGSISFGGGLPTTILSSTFNVSIDNTPLYGGYSFNVLSTGNNDMTCELFIDDVVETSVTRSNIIGVLGSVFIQTPLSLLDNSTIHSQRLECNRDSGAGIITVSEAVGIGHFLVSEDNTTLHYNETSFSQGVSSGSVFTLMDSFSVTIGNKTNTSAVDPRFNHIVIEGAITYENTLGSVQVLGTFMNVSGTVCAYYPRTVNAGNTGSISYDCVIENVTANQTYQIDIYGNGTATYDGNIIVKNFFLSDTEIAGGTGLLAGLNFSGDSPTKLFNLTGGNINHDLANVFQKLSYSIITDADTTVDFYVKIINGSTWQTKNFTRDFTAGDIGVLIGHDILEGLPEDPDYELELWANCGSIGTTCSIVGGTNLGYITDVTTTIFDSFNVTAHDYTDNSTILSFSVVDGGTYNTTTGVVQVFSGEDFENLTIRSDGYFGRLVENHNVSNDLNVTMYPGIINITSPINDTTNNTMPKFSFIFENGIWKGLTCNYYDDRNGSFVIYDTRNNVGSLIDTEFLNVPIFPDSGRYSFYVGCEDNEYQSSVYEIYYDITDPIIFFVTPSADNNSFFSTNFSLDISITDVNNYDATVNITDPLGSLIFNKNYNTSGELIYNITDLINLSVNGEHTLFIEAADGHTARNIQTFKTNYIPDGIKFNKEIAIYGYNNDYNVIATKKDDRYSMSFMEEKENFFETMYEGLIGFSQITKEEGDPDKFIVETDKGTIDIITDSDYLGHLIVKIGTDYNDWYWVDFENEQGAEVTIERLSDSAVLVNVYGLGDYTFNSIGRLNVVNQTVRFYFDTSDISLIATYEENLISGFETTYHLAATLNPIKYDLNETKTVTLNIDGDVYTPIENGSSINTFYYYYPFTIPIDYANPTLIHQWYFETLDRTNATVQVTTGPLVQNIFNVMIGNCNASLSYPIINFSYYDEVNKSSLPSNMNYVLTFFDGTYNYEAQGFFTGNPSDAICTNLNPANVTYNWNVYGQVNLNAIEDNYTTRVFTFSPASPLSASNAVLSEQELFLIKLEDSQTVEYSWLSSSYELLDGVMRIYRCNNDNTRSLIESVLITGGKSSANIELLTTSYAYDVVVNGQVYQDESYNVCHIESSQAITYYVTLTPEQLSPVSGLLFTGCSLSGPDNQSIVTMRWDDNSYDSTLITGCIQGLRNTLGNNILIFEECSSVDNGILQVTVPDNSNEYTVRGYLTQGNNSGFCNDYISVNETRDSGSVLDQTGLIMIILLILGLALYYSNNTTMSLSGTALALLLAWIIGLTAYDWLTTSSIVAFIIIILYISKGARRK